jgi:hypothetical protein
MKDLELDVVSCHHSEYYSEPTEPSGVPHSHPRWRKWKSEHDQWKANWSTAPDIEEPKPVLFPAVAAGAVFQFVVLPLRGECNSLSKPKTGLHVLARDWLRCGLETFGLGAKTGAGYGWFKEIALPEKAAAKVSSGAPGGAHSRRATTPPTEHPLISRWRGHATSDNFRVFLPELAAIEDTEELRGIFDFEAIIPENERKRLQRKSSAFQLWHPIHRNLAILNLRQPRSVQRVPALF